MSSILIRFNTMFLWILITSDILKKIGEDIFFTYPNTTVNRYANLPILSWLDKKSMDSTMITFTKILKNEIDNFADLKWVWNVYKKSVHPIFERSFM